MSAVEAVQQDEPNAWWTTLKHQGVLLSPIILEETFPDGPPGIGEREYESLRRSYRSFRNDPDELYGWLDEVFEELLGHSKSCWEKETNVSPEFRRGDLRPNRVLLDEHDDVRAMVWIDTDRVTNDDGEPGRIGIYSGKREYAKFVRLLRETGTEIGVLTNGHQFRVIHATLDHESWTEWEAQAWFQGGEGRRALRGLYGLLSDDELPAPSENEEASLLGRIKASRDRQADLSDVMGTQVREAVELLLTELDAILMEMSKEEREQILEPLSSQDRSQRDELRARYQAAIRIVMRLVVALYAESRELFPKDNPVYYNSYSVEGLFRDLREARMEEGEDSLEKQYSAWPRLQALSRLVYYGSPHSDVPLRAYGGRLFRPPGEDGDSDVLAALTVFEHDDIRLSDSTMLEVLEKLKIAEFESGGQRRTGPVDFSDLRTEYIGMMYEGLLDYELREATEDDGAILFLNLGDQPALPFNVLENLDAGGLEKLVDNLKDNASDSFLADDKVSEQDFEDDELDEDDSETADEDDADEGELNEFDDDLEARVHQWAKRVVEETRVYMPHHSKVRAMDPTTKEKYEDKAARLVVDRIIRPGGTYLVSHSGTRKSTGTFYTPPGLAVPTVHRTLEPLAYEERGETKVPKKPEEILDLQVCDPAMGSGTFPVAALRYLTDALKESFEEHVFPEVDEGDPIAAPLGDTAKGYLNERLLEIRMGENEDWQDRLEMQLKRSVVERCIYGVDINPLAVELGKLSLWIETLDPKLPFTFLDHKLRVGNSLIGAWLHEFEHYPVAAWNREGGDGRKGERTKRIKNFRNGELKEQMQNQLENKKHATHWFESGPEVEKLLKKARNLFDKMHESINEQEREQVYQAEFRDNDSIETLRHLMDRWCAIWFWPMRDDEEPVLDPDTFYETVHDSETDEIVQYLANNRRLKFFHWELEFPDVFSGEQWGFDATIGNPPWEIAKSSPVEFFTRYRPEFRTYKKQEANRVRKELFESQPSIETEWYTYKGHFRSLSNYVKNSSNPWGVPLARGSKKEELADFWSSIRESPGYGGFEFPPFSHQGSADLNTYKLFAEKFHFLVSSGGRMGMVCPTGLYLDKGTNELRDLFLNSTNWEWIYTFHNKNKIFEIPSQEKFGVNILEKGQITDGIRCCFNQKTLEDWKSSEGPTYLEISRSQINELSPKHNVVFEVSNRDNIEFIENVYKNSTPIYESGIEFATEYHTSGDSRKFSKIQKLVNEGYREKSKDRYIDKSGSEALPLLRGRMIHQFDGAYQSYVESNGGMEWNRLPHTDKQIKSEFYIKDEILESSDKYLDTVKIGYRRTTQPLINPRSMIAAIIPPLPTADSMFLLLPNESGVRTLSVVGCLNSYVFDFVLRFRVSKLNLSWFIIEECPLPNLSDEQEREIAELTAKLNWHPDIFPPIEEYTSGQITDIEYVTAESRRHELREKIDEIVARGYDVSDEQMRWMLRPDNEDARNLWTDYEKRLEALGGKGKWGNIESSEVQ